MRNLKLITHFILSLFIFLIAMLALNFFLTAQEKTHRQQTYQSVSRELIQSVQNLIHAQKEQTMMAAFSLAQNPKLITAFQQKQFGDLGYEQFLNNLKAYTSLDNPWIQILDHNGRSLFRSWSDDTGDLVYDKRADVRKILHEQKPLSSISVGLYDLTFKAMVPIMDQHRLLGVFEVITKFDSIARQSRSMGWEPVFLVDESLKSQMSRAVSQSYIHNFYVANRNVSPAALKFIEQRQLFGYAQLSHYFSDEQLNRFVVFYDINDITDQPLAHFFFIKPLDQIQDLNYMEEQHSIYVYAFLLYLIGLAIYFNGFSERVAHQQKAFSINLTSEVESKTHELQHVKRFMQSVLDGVPEALRVYDHESKLILQNESSKKSRIQGFFRDYTHPDNQKYLNDTFEKAQRHKSLLTFNELTTQPQYYEFNTSPLRNELGEITHMIELSYNITQHFQTQQQLNKQRQDLDFIHNHDTLTHLPNRQLFLLRLEDMLATPLPSHIHLAVLIIDLDRFKEINESFGHQKGDQVLIECANRLLQHAQHIDILARLGGDEFGLLLNPLRKGDDIHAIIQRVLESFEQPMFIDGHIFHITASIGVSLYPDDAKEALQLLQNADAAVYKAKGSGRNHYHFYTKDMHEKAFERTLLENSLRSAIKLNQLELYYQPQIDVNTEEVCGFEALVRWNHPNLGVVGPEKFIPLAEETGLIIPLGEKVLEMAMNTISDWHRQGLTDKRMAINISAKQLQQDDCMASFYQLLETTQCDPKWLEFEVTESAMMKDKKKSNQVLQELRKMGVQISLDDFGTGYSSLSHLKELPVNKVKIDQSFIQNLTRKGNDLEITKAIIQMTKSLNLEVIAEGIETKKQRDIVVKEGCHLIQGFMYFRPNPRGEVEKILTEQKAQSTPQA